MRHIHSKMNNEFTEMEDVISDLYKSIYDRYEDVEANRSSIEAVQQQLLNKDKEHYYY